MSVALLHAMMTASDWRVALAAIKANPRGFSHSPVMGRDNNAGPSELADSPEAAVTEAITNGYDAMIRHKEALLRSAGVTTVLEAIRRVTEGGDTIFIQCSGKNGNLTVSIGDTGCGMSENGMLNGVLGIGSSEKPANPLLHGNYGMGGLSNYGHAEAVLFVTREAGSPFYIFTLVWQEELPSGITSLRYATDASGNLFRAPASDVTFVTVDKANVEEPTKPTLQLEDGKPVPKDAHTFARLVLAEPKSKLVTLHARGIPSLPLHGTVRRQMGMAMDYYAMRDNDNTIYNAFLDRMFGSPATITLMTDGKRSKDFTTRHCRRVILEGMHKVAEASGLSHAEIKTTLSVNLTELREQARHCKQAKEYLSKVVADRTSITTGLDLVAPKAAHPAILTALANYEPLVRLPDQPISLHIKKTDEWVGGTIRVWVLDNGPPEQNGKPRSPVGYWLTGHAKGRLGLFITSNGQTHARLPSTQIVREAGYPFLPNNLIAEVSLDNIPQRLRRHLFVSTRTSMKVDIERDIIEKVTAFLKGEPILEDVNDRFSPKETTDVFDFTRVNELLHHAMNSPLLAGKFGVRHRVHPNGAIRKNRHENGGKPNPWPLLSVPSRIKVSGGEVTPGKTQNPSTFFITVKTDAQDPAFAQNIVVTSSDPRFSIITQPTTLSAGKMRVQMSCIAPEGVEATISVHTTTPLLSDRCTVIVRSNKMQHKAKNHATQNDGNMPNVVFAPITPADPAFDSLFGMLGEGDKRVDPAFTYHRNPNTEEVIVYINTEFGPLRETLKAVEQEDEGAAANFNGAYHTFCATCVVSTLVNPAGAGHPVVDDPDQQQEKHRSLASAAQGFCLIWRLNIIKMGSVSITNDFQTADAPSEMAAA